MENRFKSFLKYLVLILTLVSLSSALPACNIFQLISMTNFAGAQFAVDVELEGVETGMFSDGPVDLPITIAKLDSPDIEKIDLSIVSLGAQSENYGFGNTKFQTVETPYSVSIIGEAGAVNTAHTPNVIGYALNSNLSVDLSSQREVLVNDDGSFELEIPVEDTDVPIIFTAITPDRGGASPYIITYRDKVSEAFVIITTNSNIIRTDQEMVVDLNGYYYLSAEVEDDDIYYVRRNKSGSWIDQIVNAALITKNVHFSGERMGLVNNEGLVQVVIPSPEVSASINEEGLGLRYGVVNFSSDITTLLSYDPDETILFVNDEGVYINQFNTTNTLEFYRFSSGLKTTILITDSVTDIKFAFDVTNNKGYAVYKDVNPTYRLAELAFSGPLGLAWANRTVLATLPVTVSDVIGLEVNSNAQMVLDVNDGGTRKLYAYESSLSEITDRDVLDVDIVRPFISPEGWIVACQLAGDGEHQLVYHRLGTEAVGEFPMLTSNAGHSFCEDKHRRFYFDSDNFVHFYRTDLDLGWAQHALIKLGEYFQDL